MMRGWQVGLDRVRKQAEPERFLALVLLRCAWAIMLRF